jgi:alpha-glucosidase
VDGFRLDALNHSMFDPALTDNLPAPEDGKIRTRPFDFQLKINSQNHPDVTLFIERIADVCGQHGAVFTVAEVGGDGAVPLMKAYTAGEHRLSSAYSFDFLYAPALTGELVADALAQWTGKPGADGLSEGWPSWAFENHDAPRHISRWVGEEHRAAFARMSLVLLASLRGNMFIYQGQELALEQDEIPFHLLKDPEAIANWPLTLSRDGVRTPMPWDSHAFHAGFTTGEPWLPLSPGNIAKAVDVQEADPQSQLHWVRRVLALRAGHKALRLGAMEHVRVEGDVLSFIRHARGEKVECVFNLSAEAVAHKAHRGDALLAVNGADGAVLPPYGALWTKLP